MHFDVKNIVAVHSCKGGVGKSTVAAGLALSMASRGIRVGICDMDICGPSLAELLSISRDSVKWREVESSEVNSDPKSEEKTVTLSYSDHCSCSSSEEIGETMVLEPKEIQGIKIMSSEFLRSKDYSGYSAYRGPIIDQLCYEMVYKTDWKSLDYLILDLPPGTSDVIISLVENITITGSILVTTPHVLSNNDLVKGIKLFKDLEIPILSIVENMSYFRCGSCCDINQVFGASKVESICKEYQIDHFIKLPLMSSDQKNTVPNGHGEPKASLMTIPMIGQYHDAKSVREAFDQLIEHLELRLKFQNHTTFKNRRIRNCLSVLAEGGRFSDLKFRFRRVYSDGKYVTDDEIGDLIGDNQSRAQEGSDFVES